MESERSAQFLVWFGFGNVLLAVAMALWPFQ